MAAFLCFLASLGSCPAGDRYNDPKRSVAFTESGRTQPDIGGEHPVKPDQMQTRARHQRSHALHEFEW